MKTNNLRWLLSYFLLSSTVLSMTDTVANKAQDDAKKICITIFVHGIFSPKPYLSVSNVLKFFRDKVANSSYARSIEQTRLDPYFYQHHPMQGLGLRKVDVAGINKGAATKVYAQLFNMVEAYSSKNNTNVYYTFGWSGLLSPRMRYLEAKIFYDQMLKELAHYHTDKQKFKLRIVGYSHGANVALRLAEVYKRESYKKEKKIKIDELILIGSPVLPETDYLTNSSIFKKIYHFYSFGDRIQCLDFFSLDRVFSNRKFHDRSDFSVPEKLVQINVKVKRPVFNKRNKSFVQEEIPYLLHHKSSMRNSDPGHTELWSFGWVPTGYRHNFPLYPLPFAIFIPYILEQLNQSMPNANNLMVELHPFYENMIFYDFNNKYEKTTKFVTKKQFKNLQAHAELFRPNNLTVKEYNQKVQNTIELAQKELRKEWDQEIIIKKRKRQCARRTRFHKSKKTDIESC